MNFAITLVLVILVIVPEVTDDVGDCKSEYVTSTRLRFSLLNGAIQELAKRCCPWRSCTRST